MLRSIFVVGALCSGVRPVPVLLVLVSGRDPVSKWLIFSLNLGTGSCRSDAHFTAGSPVTFWFRESPAVVRRTGPVATPHPLRGPRTNAGNHVAEPVRRREVVVADARVPLRSVMEDGGKRADRNAEPRRNTGDPQLDAAVQRWFCWDRVGEPSLVDPTLGSGWPGSVAGPHAVKGHGADPSCWRFWLLELVLIQEERGVLTLGVSFQNPRTRAQMDSLLDAGRLDEVRSRLCGRLSFGTAGLRAPMGAGFNRINDLTVIQSTQVSGADPHRWNCNSQNAAVRLEGGQSVHWTCSGGSDRAEGGKLKGSVLPSAVSHSDPPSSGSALLPAQVFPGPVQQGRGRGL